MSEWQGLWRCPECREILSSHETPHMWKNTPYGYCNGDPIPHERRRAPQPDALVETGDKKLLDAMRWITEKAESFAQARAMARMQLVLEKERAAPRPERTYSAEDGRVTRAEPFALRPVDGRGGPTFGIRLEVVYDNLVDRDEALRRYGERKA